MKKLILHLSIIICISTIFTTIIIQIPNPIFTDVGSKDSWINFFGAITGGLLTLYGVWWTIKNQDKKRKEDLAIQYMPLIVCDNYKVEIDNVENNLLDAILTSVYSTFKGEILESNLKEVKIILKLTNYGRGEAVIKNVKSALAIYPMNDDNFINEAHDNPLNHSNIIIPVSQSKNINLILSFDKTKPIPKKMIFCIYLTYYSYFDNNKINLSSSISIKIDKKRFIDDNKIEIDLFSSDNEYDSQQKKS